MAGSSWPRPLAALSVPERLSINWSDTCKYRSGAPRLADSSCATPIPGRPCRFSRQRAGSRGPRLIFLGWRGTSWPRRVSRIIWAYGTTNPLNVDRSRRRVTQNPVALTDLEQEVRFHPIKNQLPPMKSRGIPFLTKDGCGQTRTLGQLQDPEQGDKAGSYRHPHSSQETTRDPAHMRADISPKVASAAGRPAMGQWRIEQWQPLDPPIFFSEQAVGKRE